MSVQRTKTKISSYNRYIFKFLITLLLIVIQFHTSIAWDLAQTGLREPYLVRHLSLHYPRVFLCISVQSESFPTLIATNWPGSYIPLQSVIYPAKNLHPDGNRNNCELIQKAVWTQVDNLGRLWVLDAGWSDVCTPKLLVYDLVRNNVEVLRIDCSSYLSTKEAESVVIKLGPRPEPCKVEKYLYFVLPNDTHILAYDIIEQKWQKRLLFSRKYHGIIETPFPIKPIDIEFGKQNELLVSDADGKLYATSNLQLNMKLENMLQKQRTQENNNDMIINANALDIEQQQEQQMQLIDSSTYLDANEKSNAIELELLGSLLGPSRSMILEVHTGRLFYAVAKYGAVVRSNYQYNMTAEDNEIIYLTSKNIQQIFFSRDGVVWLLTDRLLHPSDRCFGNI